MIEVFFSIFNITTSCSGLVDSKGQSLDDEYMEDNYGAPLNMVRYIYYHHHFLTINIIITIIITIIIIIITIITIIVIVIVIIIIIVSVVGISNSAQSKFSS